MVEALQPKRDLSRAAIRQVGFERPLPALLPPEKCASPRERSPKRRRQPAPPAESDLTEAQLLFWCARKLQPEVQLCFDRTTTTFILPGELDRGHFERAFDALLGVCGVLRSRIHEVDGVPRRSLGGLDRGVPGGEPARCGDRAAPRLRDLHLRLRRQAQGCDAAALRHLQPAALDAGRLRAHSQGPGPAVGGNSLMATQVATMLQKVLPIEIDLRKVFEGPTAAEVVEAERLALGDRERAVMAGISSNSSRRWTRSEGHRPMTRLTAIDQPVRLTSRDRNGP